MVKKILAMFLLVLIGITNTYAQNKNKRKKASNRPVDFLELAQTRYTTKEYDPSKKVSDKDIDKLSEILRLTPSSVNSQPWQFVIVSDEKLKDRLANVSMGGNANRVRQSSHLVVFRGVKDISKFKAYGGASLGKDNEANVRAWIGHQVYISLGFFLAACADMGIDSTPMEGIMPLEYDRTLDMGNDYETLFAVAIGYRSLNDGNQPSKKPKQRLPKEDVVKFR